MPKWWRESKAWEQEQRIIEATGSPRPGIEELSRWRETTDLCVLEALEMYATFLGGQSSGFSDALSLPAVDAAFRILRYPLKARPAMTWILLRIHSGLVDIQKREAKTKGKHG